MENEGDDPVGTVEGRRKKGAIRYVPTVWADRPEIGRCAAVSGAPAAVWRVSNPDACDHRVRRRSGIP